MSLGDRLAQFVSSLTPQPGIGVWNVGPMEANEQPADWPGAPPYLMQTPWIGDQFAQDYPRAAAFIPTIFACVDKLSTDTASLPIVWEQRSGKGVKLGKWEPLDDSHWLPKLFSDGNKEYSGYEVMRDLTAGLDMSGTSLLFADRHKDDTGKPRDTVPTELWHVPYHMARAIPGPFRSIRGYMWWPMVQMMSSEDITPFRYWNPNWSPPYPGPEGLSPLSAARLSFETRYSQTRWQRGLFKRGAQVAGMFTPDGPEFALKEKDARKIQARLRRISGGSDDPNDPVVVAGLKQVRPPILPKDLLFLEMMAATDRDVFMIYGIPPALMGYKESGSLSTAGMESDMLLYDTGPLAKRAELIGRIITDQFCKKWAPGIRCRLDLSGRTAMATSLLSQVEALTKAAGRPIYTLNQARAIQGAEPATDPNADKYLVPFNAVLSEDVGADIRVDPAAAGDAGGNRGGGKDGAAPPAEKSSNARRMRASSPGRKRVLRKWRDADLARYERQVSRWADGRFTAQEARVVARLKSRSADANGGSKPNLKRAVRFAEGADDFDLEGPDDWQQAQELFARIIADRGEAAAAEVGAKIALDVQRGRVADLINRRSHDVIQNLDSTTSELLREVLRDAVQHSASLDDLVLAVREVFQRRRDNAETIARTETAWAYNTASNEAWTQAGVRFKSWLTSHDGAVRESHAGCEAQGVIGMEEAFENGLRYPGDPDGDADEVCNCRCILNPEFNAEGGDLPDDATDGGTSDNALARMWARNGHANGNGVAQHWPDKFWEVEK